MLVLHAGSWAGPVPAAEADAAVPTSALADLSPRAPGAGMTLSAEAAASAPAGSALAVEMIKEAGAGASVADTPRSRAREATGNAAQAAAPKAPPPKPANAADDPWGLRDLGKAAVQWAKQSIPWLRKAEDERDAARSVTLHPADWSASPLEPGQPARRADLSHNPPAGAGEDPLSAPSYGEAAQQKMADAEQNAARVLFNAVREVLDHPMAWLVAALFVIGGVVVKKIDRRPTK